MSPSNDAAAGMPASPANPERPPLPVGSLVVGPGVATVVALLAGLLAWGIISWIDPVFTIPAELAVVLTGPADAEKLAELEAAEAVVTRHSTALWMGILGVLAGLLLALVESTMRASILRALANAIVAAVICGAVAAAAGYTSQFVLVELEKNRELTPMTRTVILQVYMLGVFGFGLGLAISLPLLSPRLMVHCVIGCMLGGVFAAIVYAPSIGYLLPRVRTERVFPREAMARLIWLSLAMGLIGLTVAGLGKDKRPRRQKQEGSPPPKV